MVLIQPKVRVLSPMYNLLGALKGLLSIVRPDKYHEPQSRETVDVSARFSWKVLSCAVRSCIVSTLARRSHGGAY